MERRQNARDVVRAILSVVDPVTAVSILNLLAVWWRAIVAVAVEGDEHVGAAEHAIAAVHKAAPPCAVEAIVAAVAGVSESELVTLALNDDERTDVVDDARVGLAVVRDLVAEHQAEATRAATQGAGKRGAVAALVDLRARIAELTAALRSYVPSCEQYVRLRADDIGRRMHGQCGKPATHHMSHADHTVSHYCRRHARKHRDAQEIAHADVVESLAAEVRCG